MRLISWLLDITHRDWEVTCVRFCRSPVLLQSGEVVIDGELEVMCRRRNGRWEYRWPTKEELWEDAYTNANTM